MKVILAVEDPVEKKIENYENGEKYKKKNIQTKDIKFKK